MININNPLNPEIDQPLISPYNHTMLFIKIVRIKDMIAKLRCFDCEVNSPCQNQRKSTEKSMENIGTAVRVERVKIFSIAETQQHKASNLN